MSNIRDDDMHWDVFDCLREKICIGATQFLHPESWEFPYANLRQFEFVYVPKAYLCENYFYVVIKRNEFCLREISGPKYACFFIVQTMEIISSNASF